MKEWINNFMAYSEYSFCLDNNILKPDKFFINENEAIVIDFKTGKSMPEYNDQVANYCKAVKGIFGKPTKGYIYYTQSKKFDEVTI
jgi:CRISPR/Cas system-associated exonuclease Cas4 (RecB family)